MYSSLLRDIDITKPDQVWAADITYVRMKDDHVYLLTIMDWYSRYVVQWAVSPTKDAYKRSKNESSRVLPIITD